MFPLHAPLPKYNLLSLKFINTALSVFQNTQLHNYALYHNLFISVHLETGLQNVCTIHAQKMCQIVVQSPENYVSQQTSDWSIASSISCLYPYCIFWLQ